MNRLFLLLCGMVTFVAHAQVPDYVPAEGLVGWWPLDGHALDSGPDELHGVLNGTSTVTNRFNEVESALSLDGANDWVDFGYNDAWHLEGFTLNIWYSTLEWPQLGDYDAIVAAGDAYFMFVGDAGPGGGGNSSFYVSTSPLQGGVWSYENNSDGQWHMMTGIRDASAESIELYIDGVNVGSAAASGGLLVGEQPLSIGRFWDFNPHWFDGNIDDFGIWNRTLTEEEILALYNAQLPIPGCTDSTACNFNEEANDDDGSCVYPLFGDDCETGGAACGEGTVWDSASQSCVAWNDCPSDLDGDGVIGVSDLMELLADFGTNCPNPQSCGDPVNYHGYDYSTVQIGEQCWFAENLRTEQYQSGDSIPGDLSSSQWTNTETGAQAVYGDNEGNLDLYGRLYNGYAMADTRALCPTNWHVPSDEDWGVLELELGLDENELLLIGERGDDQGNQLKASTSDTPSWDGTNTSGFSAVANGYRHNHGYYQHLNFNSHYWSQTASEAGVFYIRTLQNSVDGVIRLTRVANSGYTVRCIAD